MATRKNLSEREEREAKRLANEAAINRAYGCKPRPRYRDDPAAWPPEKKRSGKDAWRTYYGYRYRPDAGPEKSLNPSGPGAKFPPAAVAAALVAHEERGHERTAWPSAREAAEAAPVGDKWPWIAAAEKAGKLVAYTAESERQGRRLRAVLYVGEGVCEVREERERGGPWRKLDTHTAAYAAGSAALWEVKRADTAREAVASGVGRMRPAVCTIDPTLTQADIEPPADAAVAAIRAARERYIEPTETPDVAPGTAWQRVEPAMPGPLAPASDLELCASVLRSLADAYGPRRAHKLRAMADFVESHGQPRLRQAAE